MTATDVSTIRPAARRGATSLGWLDSRHSFSFGGYFDPEYMGYRALRVVNDDRVAAGGGFGTHPHADMEIVSVVVEGELSHRDSLGNGSVMRPGDIQRMTAGTGILHSEYNPSDRDGVRFLQIWIVPERRGLEPSYEQRRFDIPSGTLRLVGSPDGRDGSVTIHQDVELLRGRLEPGDQVRHRVADGRGAWIQIVSGLVEVGGVRLDQGDGMSLEGPRVLTVTGVASGSDLLLFDLG